MGKGVRLCFIKIKDNKNSRALVLSRKLQNAKEKSIKKKMRVVYLRNAVDENHIKYFNSDTGFVHFPIY